MLQLANFTIAETVEQNVMKDRVITFLIGLI